ncbi:MAG: hypothetical protein ACYCWE_17630 [Eubacteriales bacterium]
MGMMKRAVVTFIDILGFKNLVQNKSENEMSEILSLFRKCNTENPLDKYTSDNYMSTEKLALNIKTVFFSDSVVRIRYASDWEKGVLSDGYYMCILEKELLLLADIQSDLLKKGILTRGGTTIGDILYDEETNQLFGKAMNRAYELESNIANYPRIVIDPTFSNVYSRSIELIESPIYIDSEMLFSVDYFNEREAKLLLWNLKRWPEKRNEIFQRIKSSIISQKKLLEEHRKAIIELLLQSTRNMRINQVDSPAEHLFAVQDIKIFGKHAWIANRFNTAINNWEKVRAVVGDNNAFVDKIFLRDCEWTDPQFLMDANSFSNCLEIYDVEDL